MTSHHVFVLWVKARHCTPCGFNGKFDFVHRAPTTTKKKLNMLTSPISPSRSLLKVRLGYEQVLCYSTKARVQFILASFFCHKQDFWREFFVFFPAGSKCTENEQIAEQHTASCAKFLEILNATRDCSVNPSQ